MKKMMWSRVCSMIHPYDRHFPSIISRKKSAMTGR
jgi:hypothetical protein